MSDSQSRRICWNCPIALTLTAVFAINAVAQERQINGNSLLTEVATELRQLDRVLTAKTKVEIHAFGQTIIGKGEYAQCPLKGEFLVCTTLQAELVSRRKVSYSLNRNENELIVRHDLNDGRKFAGRVSLRRLREAGVLKSGSLAAGGVPGAISTPALAPVDGIASTLEALSTHFQFDKKQSKEVEGTHFAAMRGSWKLASRALVQSDDGKIPESMPDTVEVVIETPPGKDLPRFPRSITYLKRVSKGGVATFAPIVAIQYENVEIMDSASVDVGKFKFEPDDKVKVVDITDQYLVPPPQ